MADHKELSTSETPSTNSPHASERYPVKWYRSSYYNATILGLCSFAAPGLWGAMMGAGCAASPEVVNAAKALTFCLMIVSCYFRSVLVKSEAAIAIAYPEPYNGGKILGYWLTYTLFGQVLGGAINLGLNSERGEAGAVSYKVYLIFIAIQSMAPLEIVDNVRSELKEMGREFLGRKFLLLVPLIGAGVYSEAVYFTYIALWFSVRARALGSFISAIVTIITINGLGRWLDHSKLSLKTRTRGAFWAIILLQGAWWTWATVNVTRYRRSFPSYDWSDEGFGAGFAVFIFLRVGFHFFIITNLAQDEQQIIRYSALLRGAESAWQALSYGLGSLSTMATVGSIYLNFGLWAVSIFPAWLVVRHVGVDQAPLGRKEDLQVSAENHPVATEVDAEIKNINVVIAFWQIRVVVHSKTAYTTAMETSERVCKTVQADGSRLFVASCRTGTEGTTDAEVME
ncbi:uncharacterized protein AB675_5155 [Cyphellophora attinorum]|uniref:Uncharacterized protein n=1 Tax=Cyphellophora attinorum TaxID=1664694 RepID=A0A0N1H8F7_9EURO|nr:uncharacterized protein AB675_5155 [Phialophora attinorum]KPI39392.1 hypothetical protein AB675_5155 [Phialophora attinorum]